MEILKLLASLGLPSAIVAMAIIAYLFKDKYDKISKASLVVAISLAGLLGVYQLVALIVGKDVIVSAKPENFSAINSEGRISPAEIRVLKGDNVVKKKTFAAFDSLSIANRSLTLNYADSSRFRVMSGAFAQGVLNYQVLRDNGWRPGSEVQRGSQTPRYWFTHKVFVGGDEVMLGDTGDAGTLSLKFFAIKNDRAQVRLILKGQSKPTPRSVGILNKGVEAQDFEGLPTFYIAVREANFSEKWAAFSIFQYRGY